jgi:hypothetical protein
MENEMRKLINQIKKIGKNNIIEESNGLWANIHAKRKRGEKPAKPGDKDYPNKKQWKKLTTEEDENDNNYMFWQNLQMINELSAKLLAMDKTNVDAIIANGHAWAVDHISTSFDDIDEVYHFLESNNQSKED